MVWYSILEFNVPGASYVTDDVSMWIPAVLAILYYFHWKCHSKTLSALTLLPATLTDSQLTDTQTHTQIAITAAPFPLSSSPK